MEKAEEDPKESASSSRKNELLRKTAKIFAEKGYQACTVQEIAYALSISKGGLYWHFKSKEELYCQVCESYCISSVAAIRAMLNKPQLTFVDLQFGFTHLLEGYLDDPIQVDLIIDFYAESKRSNFIQNNLLGLLQKREADLILLIERLIAENIIKKIDSVWTARALVSGLMGMLFKYSIIKDKSMVMAEFQGFFDLFFQKA